MKSPSKNMSASLRGQSPGGDESPRISKQSPESAAGRIIPGESGVEAPPGRVPARSVKPFAGAVGRRFGGGR